MALSLPSKHTVNVDVPEIRNFQARFVYNFFTVDEKVNDSGAINAKLVKELQAQNFDKSVINSLDFKRVVPRFIRFTWIPAKGASFRSDINIKDNYKKIHNEQAFLSDNYTNVFIQNKNIQENLKWFINQAIETYKNTINVPEQLSNLDKLKFLKQNLPVELQDEFLTKAFMDLTDQGYLSLNPALKEVLSPTSFVRQVSNTKTSVQINNKFLHRMLSSMENNPTVRSNENLSQVLNQSKNKQENSVANNNSTTLDAENYEFSILDYIDIRKIDSSGFDPKTQIIGYIIDKKEVLDNGSVEDHDPVFVENPITYSFVDFKVKYNASYEYSIRTIAAIETQVQNDETNEVVALTYLVSSMPSQIVVVDCVENVPPPPPADFKVDYDFNNDAARLIWSFPVNSQRDIKGFQVLRRTSTDEPFELIKLYDFDDSEVISPYDEEPDPDLIEVSEQPTSYYLDKEFDFDSRFIYAVCSIDAHGMTSNYSNQFLCTFDRMNRKIRAKQISKSGAPKPYPNALLEEEAFVESIKDSGHSKVHIYFDPETLKLTSNNEEVEFLKSKYKLQFINVDNQEEQNLSINIDDKRSTQNKVNVKKKL